MHIHVGLGHSTLGVIKAMGPSIRINHARAVRTHGPSLRLRLAFILIIMTIMVAFIIAVIFLVITAVIIVVMVISMPLRKRHHALCVMHRRHHQLYQPHTPRMIKPQAHCKCQGGKTSMLMWTFRPGLQIQVDTKCR